MKRFVLALIAFAALWPAMAHAAEQRLRTGDLRAMADRGALLCERWDEAGQRCDAVYRWNRVGGQLTETRLESASNLPPIDTALQYPIEIRDDQVCTTLDANSMSLLVLANGRELTSEEAAPIRTAIDTVFTPVNGQTICTAFYRDDATAMLRAEATLNGQPRAELGTRFRPLDGPPLPRMRPVRQPWTLSVLRTVRAVFPETSPAGTAATAAPEAGTAPEAATAPTAQSEAPSPSPSPSSTPETRATASTPASPARAALTTDPEPAAAGAQAAPAPASATPAPPSRCSLWARIRGRCAPAG